MRPSPQPSGWHGRTDDGWHGVTAAGWHGTTDGGQHGVTDDEDEVAHGFTPVVALLADTGGWNMTIARMRRAPTPVIIMASMVTFRVSGANAVRIADMMEPAFLTMSNLITTLCHIPKAAQRRSPWAGRGIAPGPFSLVRSARSVRPCGRVAIYYVMAGCAVASAVLSSPGVPRRRDVAGEPARYGGAGRAA